MTPQLRPEVSCQPEKGTLQFPPAASAELERDYSYPRHPGAARAGHSRYKHATLDGYNVVRRVAASRPIAPSGIPRSPSSLLLPPVSASALVPFTPTLSASPVDRPPTSLGPPLG